MGFRNPVAAGLKLLREALQSENYTPGTDGWSIERDGDAEFNDITVRGELTVEGTETTFVAGERFARPLGTVSPGVFWELDGSEVNAGKPGGIAHDGNTASGQAAILIWPQTAIDETAIPYLALVNEIAGLPGVSFGCIDDDGPLVGDGDWLFYVSKEYAALFEYRLTVGHLGNAGEPLLIVLDSEGVRGRNFDGTADVTLPLNPNGGEVTYNGVALTRRLGRSVRTASVGTFTAETLIDTITVDVVNGRDYEIVWDGHWNSTIVGDRITLRIYEEDTGAVGFGNVLRAMFPVRATHVSSSSLEAMRAFYTADANESKTFNVTMQRSTGTGNITAPGSAASPALLTVDETA